MNCKLTKNPWVFQATNNQYDTSKINKWRVKDASTCKFQNQSLKSLSSWLLLWTSPGGEALPGSSGSQGRTPKAIPPHQPPLNEQENFRPQSESKRQFPRRGGGGGRENEWTLAGDQRINQIKKSLSSKIVVASVHLCLQTLPTYLQDKKILATYLFCCGQIYAKRFVYIDSGENHSKICTHNLLFSDNFTNSF